MTRSRLSVAEHKILRRDVLRRDGWRCPRWGAMKYLEVQRWQVPGSPTVIGKNTPKTRTNNKIKVVYR